MISDRSRLQATLGRPELKRLVERLRTRVERGGLLTGVLTLSKATPTERDAVNRLLGRLPSRGSTLVIDLGQLEDKLRAAGLAANLRVAVEQITGAIVDRHAQREIEEREWKNLFFDASKKVENRPELQTWITQLRLTGSLRRYGITDARKLVQQALDIITALPAQDTPLAELAASILGDAHALDPDTSLSSIILRAVAVLGKCEKFDDAQSRRDAWASVGVVCDELSAAVLVLNLRSSDNTAVGRVLRIYAESGEPTFLSVRQLLRTPPMFTISDVGPVVYVCENPSVVAAAANRLGGKGLPLVCIEGQPRTATRLLLNQLQAAGIRLMYHGDFDWAGIQIANTIVARHRAVPWRMTANDYRTTATRFFALSGTPIAANWDSELMPAMCSIGRVVHEEQVIDIILADLARR
jgi:uncharacterized protein (TIGR02679 family)